AVRLCIWIRTNVYLTIMMRWKLFKRPPRNLTRNRRLRKTQTKQLKPMSWDSMLMR
ncbi:hypothetical protein GCK32_019144, partial [Trichostrongylus colubriformis]